ncbi:hypothetical protein ONZ45_g7656 [Pleurotus djamor]|nr:hypothetical protein ONZ45_g15593 [Pleurotus djamor]KAJ8514855.1 hypothetical protein ONZ45_g7656 [Pleurotus djamor]
MAYSAYDMGRQISRRGSMSYAPTPYPYSDPGVYGGGGDSMMMGADYPPQQYPIYAPSGGHGVPMHAYDDGAYRDGYYDERAMSAAPMMHPSMSVSSRRSRRYSSVSYPRAQPFEVQGYRPNSPHIKFKRKGAFTAGINLAEAQSHQRLSNNDAYSFHDFHPDHRGRILLKIKWTGYNSMTYEIPLDKYDGRVCCTFLVTFSAITNSPPPF